jgi:hypothetical protein
MTATALSLGAVVAAFLTYEYLSSSEKILSRWSIQHFWSTTPERSARYRAARYRRHLLLARIIRRTAPRQQIPVVGPEMIKGLVEEIFPTKKSHKNQRPLDRSTNAGGLNRTADDPRVPPAADLLRIDRIEQNQDGDYVLWFVIRSNSTSSSSTSFWRGRRKQACVPLLPFCRAVLESPHVDTHTLCFLYDATGGQDDMVVNLLQADPSVVTIRPGCRPALWMQQCATDLHLSKDHQDLVLQSLVRVDAALILLQAKAATTTTPVVKPKSIVVPISTEFVPLLMAPLSAVFPNDKHIFLYTGCIQAVAAMQQQHRPIWPLQPLVSIHIRKPTEFHAALAKLPNSLSAAVEAWMAAVDTFILRQDDSQDRFFRPYVCRLDYLFMSAGQMDHNGAGTEPNNNWAVRSLFRYCCGATATIDPHLVQAAIKTLQSTTPTALLPSVVASYGPDIDAAVFCHERIVLSHRILPNTVPPAEHGTLVATGVAPDCACCIGSTEDDEAADNKGQTATEQEGAMSLGARSEFADGRMGFAFDPSRFG